MSRVYRHDKPTAHRCSPPRECPEYATWRCEDCRRIWACRKFRFMDGAGYWVKSLDPKWQPARWLDRHRHRDAEHNQTMHEAERIPSLSGIRYRNHWWHRA